MTRLYFLNGDFLICKIGTMKCPMSENSCKMVNGFRAHNLFPGACKHILNNNKICTCESQHSNTLADS